MRAYHIVKCVKFVAIATVIVGGFRSCSDMYSHQYRNTRDTKVACVQADKQWINGNCIAVGGGK